MRPINQNPYPDLIEQMRRPEFYPHAVQEPIQVEETHISYVLLTGDYAYKIKKPLDLGFLDFSTLERRRYYCLEELRLNSRLSPDLYLDVLPILATPGGCRLGEGLNIAPADAIVEYTLRMRQFPQETLFSRMFAQGRLTYDHMVALGQLIADLHLGAPSDEQIRQYGSVDAVRRVVGDNYAATRAYIGRGQTAEQFEQTRAFTGDFLDRHAGWFERRQAEGFVRVCHGDLHLANVCLYQGQVRVFDCIEFNEAFRNIDVMYDVAFMAMDLEFRARPDLACAFLNAYLEHTGDYWGAALLPFYKSMRAYVRAKVESFLLDEPEASAAVKETAALQAALYYRLAWEYTRPSQGRLLAMTGLSGSGKTTLARYLTRRLGAIHIRSDAVRKHLGGVPLWQRGDESLYTPEMTGRTYDRLLELAVFLARQGLTVVLDARFDRRPWRDALAEQAREHGLPLRFFVCHAPLPILRERLAQRRGDIADATPDLLEAQARDADPLDEREQAYVVDIDTMGDWQRELDAFVSSDSIAGL